jgi:hypothetical protein
MPKRKREELRIPPTHDQVRAAIGAAGLSTAEVGDLLGVDPRTVRRWIGGDRVMPWATWFALRTLIEERSE